MQISIVQQLIKIGSRMKEEKKSKDRLEKMKERRNKKSGEKGQLNSDQAFQKIENYKIFIDKLIGQGSFGRVYKAKNDETDQLLACKVISKNKLQQLKMYREEYASQLEKRFNTQSEFHKKLSGCPHIVKLIDTIQNKKAYYFFMEYCETDLSKIIKTNGILPQKQALRYFTEMVEGYKSIFSNNAFHRDLKPQNLLIKDNSIKISDFGFVKIFSEMDLEKQCRSGKNKLRTESKVGSFKYMAPDVLSLASQGSTVSTTYNAQKSDIWSMGIILYKMLYGKEPYNGKDEEQMVKVISQKQLNFPDTFSITPEVIKNTNVSSDIKRLLKKMIEKDQDKRITFKKLFSKIEDLNKDRQKQKKEKKADEQPTEKEGTTLDKKEHLLLFYGKVMSRIYNDASKHTFLREIGLEQDFQKSMKLITLLHYKRSVYLQELEPGDSEKISQKIQQDISTYHNFYIPRFQVLGKVVDTKQSIDKQLLPIFPLIKAQTEQYPEMSKQLLFLLLDLMLLLSLELKIYEPSYVYLQSGHLQKKRKDVIKSHWDSLIEKIQKKIKNKNKDVSSEAQQIFQMVDKKHEKKHRHKDRDKEDDHQHRKEKKHKKSRSHDKHKSRQKKQKA